MSARTATIVATAARSARASVALLARGRLAMPRDRVGREVRGPFGNPFEVFRETRLVGAPTEAPTLLVIGFRLRGLGRSRPLHALFRVVCVATTPFWAGIPGFRTKLWLHDDDGGYAGLYEWDGEAAARQYLECLVPVLRALSVPGSVSAEAVPGHTLDAHLGDVDAKIGA